MNWEVWIPLLIAIAAWIPKILEVLGARKTKQEREGERRSLDAKTEGDIAKAAESIAAGSTVTIANLLRDLEYWKRETSEARAEIDTIVESRRIRDIETQKERDELKARITADQKDTQKLQGEIFELQKRIEKDTSETEALRQQVAEIEEKYRKQLRINARLVKALEDAHIPLPDFNGDMGDSIRGLKWDK